MLPGTVIVGRSGTEELGREWTFPPSKSTPTPQSLARFAYTGTGIPDDEAESVPRPASSGDNCARFEFGGPNACEGNLLNDGLNPSRSELPDPVLSSTEIEDSREGGLDVDTWS